MRQVGGDLVQQQVDVGLLGIPHFPHIGQVLHLGQIGLAEQPRPGLPVHDGIAIVFGAVDLILKAGWRNPQGIAQPHPTQRDDQQADRHQQAHANLAGLVQPQVPRGQQGRHIKYLPGLDAQAFAGAQQRGLPDGLHGRYARRPPQRGRGRPHDHREGQQQHRRQKTTTRCKRR